MTVSPSSRQLCRKDCRPADMHGDDADFVADLDPVMEAAIQDDGMFIKQRINGNTWEIIQHAHPPRRADSLGARFFGQSLGTDIQDGARVRRFADHGGQYRCRTA